MKKKMKSVVLAVLMSAVLTAPAQAAQIADLGGLYVIKTDENGDFIKESFDVWDPMWPTDKGNEYSYRWLDGYCYGAHNGYLQKNVRMPNGWMTDGEGRILKEDGTLLTYEEQFPYPGETAEMGTLAEYQKDMNGIFGHMKQELPPLMTGDYLATLESADTSYGWPNTSLPESTYSVFGIGKMPFIGKGNSVVYASVGSSSNYTVENNQIVWEWNVTTHVTLYDTYLSLLNDSERQAAERVLSETLTGAAGRENAELLLNKLHAMYGTDNRQFNEYGKLNEHLYYHIMSFDIPAGSLTVEVHYVE